MSQEEEIRAAIVVLPDGIAFASPEMNDAAEKLAFSAGRFTDFIATIEPTMKRHESMLVASAIIDSLPELINTNPKLLAGIKKLIKEVIQ